MKDARTPLEDQRDGYNKVAHDIPYNHELEAMNYKQLSVELQQSAVGSARHSVIAHEMEKRKQSLSASKKGWIHKNGGTLLWGILASLIAAALWFYYGLT